jgi:tetratricopeptide (TPR) repeat protein
MANKKQEGTYEDTLNQSEAFFLKYKKAIIIAIAAIVVIVAGCILYHNYVAVPQEEEASTALAKGQEYLNAEQFDKALKGDGAGFVGFEKIASDYSSTKAGNLAKLYTGICYASQQKPDWKKAQQYLEDFDTKDDQLISPASQAALANAYANNGDIDKAISTFKKAADMADSEAKDGVSNSLAPTFLKEAAILLESQGKKDEALSIYQDIKKKYVNSAAYQDIDKYIERASN